MNSNPSKPEPQSQPDHDPRASQAMPWLAGPGTVGAQPGAQPGAQAKPGAQAADPLTADRQATEETANNLNDPNDPDAKDLPPGVVLPDAKLYAMRQLKAQMINFIAISVFIVGWSVLVIPDKPQVGLVCSGITLALTLFTVTRFWFARRAWLAAQTDGDTAQGNPTGRSGQ